MSQQLRGAQSGNARKPGGVDFDEGAGPKGGTISGIGAEQSDPTDELARLRAEVERLRAPATSDGFAKDLRDTLTWASATGVIGAPVGHTALLQLIVATTADIIGATAAALFLIDADQESLACEALLEDRTHRDVDAFRVPLGEGMAGLVALNGQSMSVTDTFGDDIDAVDVTELAARLRLVPSNVLCVPLSFQGRVIGVLEFLDDAEGPSFDMDTVAALALSANLAAVAIEQSRTQSRMTALLVQLIEGLDAVPDYDRFGLSARARAFTAELGQDSGYLDALQLARLVQEAVRHGDAATTAAKRLLEGFVDYLRFSAAPSGPASAEAWR